MRSILRAMSLIPRSEGI